LNVDKAEFSHQLTKHLVYALLLGLFLRLLTSYFSYGAMALDDYRHGIWPAFQNWSGIPPNLPAYRSHMIIWLIGFFYSVADLFGISSSIGQVRVAYMGLGLISLTGILGTYLYVKKSFNYRYALLAIYLSAAYFLAPFASTRAFGECIAIGLIMLGFGLLKSGEQDNKTSFVFLSFLALGLATLFRYQVGLIYVAVGVYYLVQRHWLFVTLGFIAGLVTLGLEVGIDILSNKHAFETLLAYFKVNEGGAVSYGVSPWYNTWLTALGFTLFPFSLIFWKWFKELWENYKVELVSVAFFLLVHSLIPHKEERFVFPILLLMTLFTSFLMDRAWETKRFKYFYLPLFALVNIIGLTIATFSNSQGSELGPIEYAEKRYKKYILLSKKSIIDKSRVRKYYIRDHVRVVKFNQFSLINAKNLKWVKADLEGAEAIVVVTSNREYKYELDKLSNHEYEGNLHCGAVQESQSLSDWILYSINPGKNRKRGPSWFMVCEISD
jgi:hypothetical protein